ncbi:MAG: GlsB/YeaQ/YmgE family stress response membrane protein [Longispora sp.]|nr:GlsB/YeaQ/YmgE family stress response membrane protein [Longispora sp. (in: high G+C Gram-positive bacteria)]
MGRILGMLLAAIIIGPLIGLLGRLLLPGRQNISIAMTIGVGIVAAFVGGIIALLFGWDNTGGIDWLQWGVQILLAIIGVALVAARGSTRGRTI